MPTSELGYYVRFAESAIDDLDPCDTGMLRRAVGNLDHVADQYAQVRVSWVAPTTALTTGSDATYATDPNETEAGVPWRLWTSTPFDLHVRADGTSYPCRVHLRVTSGSASDAATFYAVLAPVEASEAEVFEAGPNSTTITVTQSTTTWELADDLVYLDEARVNRVAQDAAIINEIGGAPASARWLRAQLSVWVDVEDATSVAVLSGAKLHEYLPPDA